MEINANNKPGPASSTVTRDLRELDVKTDNKSYRLKIPG